MKGLLEVPLIIGAVSSTCVGNRSLEAASVDWD